MGLDPSIVIAGIEEVGSPILVVNTVITRPGFSGYEHASFDGNQVIAVENVFEDENQQPVDQSVAHCYTIDDLFSGNDGPVLQDLGEPAYSGFGFDEAGQAWGVRDNDEAGTQEEEAFYPTAEEPCRDPIKLGMKGFVVPGLTQLASYDVTILQSRFIGTGRFTDVPGFLTPTPVLNGLSRGSAAQITLLPAPADYVSVVNIDASEVAASLDFSPGPNSPVDDVKVEMVLLPLEASGFLMSDAAGSFAANLQVAGGQPSVISSTPSPDGRIYVVVAVNGRLVDVVIEKPRVGTASDYFGYAVNTTDTPANISTGTGTGDGSPEIWVGSDDGAVFDLGFEKEEEETYLRWEESQEQIEFGFEYAELSGGAGWLAIFFREGPGKTNQIVELALFNMRGEQIEAVATPTERGAELPADDLTITAHPNPFETSATITFDLPESGHVRLEMFDQLGRKVATIVDEHRVSGSGTVEWDGRTKEGFRLPAGLYLYRLTNASRARSGSIILVE